MPETSPSRRRWPSKLGIPAAVIVTLTAAVLWQASQRVSTGPAAGTSFEGTPHHDSQAASASGSSVASHATRSAHSFRVGTFNMHHGQGLDGRLDLARIAGQLRDCDFVGLQEVWGPHVFRGTQQARELGELLGMSWLYAPTERRWWHEHGGNGALSKVPVTAWLRIPLPAVEGRSPRNCLLTTLEIDGRPVRILVTHLEAVKRAARDEQLRIVRELFRSLDSPAILLGDFNTRRDEPELQKLLQTEGVIDALQTGALQTGALQTGALQTGALQPDERQANTQSSVPLSSGPSNDDSRTAAEPREDRIDHIFVRGLKVLRAGYEPADASDHPFLWADCEIP